tara:strand:+ start:144 stop:515 length:372 start_codon:yes stop_codon:yes gene_type:complete
MTFSVTTTKTDTVTQDHIGSLLCSAFEGGSNYWYSLEQYSKTEDGYLDYWGLADPDGSQQWIVVDREDVHEKHHLNRVAIQRGLQVLANKYPERLQEIVQEDADAETADVFLQCALFGEVIFG